jgi:hypothetical protein
MAKTIEMAGRKFNRLTVLKQQGRDSSRNIMWLCKCDCGNEITVAGCSLRRGFTQSCGCLSLGNRNHLTHGMSDTIEYNAWCSMRQRCENPNTLEYHNYGGRGITVCERWRNSFASFVEDMGPRPSKEYSIDRINVNGNYEPSNCRWATKEEQANNKRNRTFVIHNGHLMTLAQKARITGIPQTTLRRHEQALGNIKQEA